MNRACTAVWGIGVGGIGGQGRGGEARGPGAGERGAVTSVRGQRRRQSFRVDHAAIGQFDAPQWRVVRLYHVFAQIPLVLLYLAAHFALELVAERVYVDDVLFEVEGVGEGAQTVGANRGLHAAPALPVPRRARAQQHLRICNDRAGRVSLAAGARAARLRPDMEAHRHSPAAQNL